MWAGEVPALESRRQHQHRVLHYKWLILYQKPVSVFAVMGAAGFFAAPEYGALKVSSRAGPSRPELPGRVCRGD